MEQQKGQDQGRFQRYKMPVKKAREEEFIDKFTEEIINNLRKDFSAIEKEKKDEERKKMEKELQEMKEKFSKEVVNMQPTKIKPPQQIISKPIEQKAIQQIPIKPKESIQFKKPAPLPEKPKQLAPPKPINIESPKVLPQIIPGEIDFGKIIYLIKDPLITYIECPGPDKNIIIRKAGNSFMTQIKLTKEEMIAIIKSFSVKTRIPLVEGMLTARYDGVEISAIISETVTSSFIIKKDIIPSLKAPPTQLQPPNKPYIKPGLQKITRFPIPGIAMRPMPQRTQGMPPRQPQPEQKKESIWNKKIKIGK